MAHEFHSGLDAPQRAKVREAVVARLQPLHRDEGGYLQAIVFWGGDLSSEEDRDDLVELLRGRAPAIAIGMGAGTFTADGMTLQRNQHRKDIELTVFVATGHLRSRETRMTGDVVSAGNVTVDPGLEVMLEQVEDLLIALDPPFATIKPLLPVSEGSVWNAADLLVWAQRYRCTVQRVRRPYDAVLAELQEILADHNLVDGGDANPVATTLSEVDPPEEP